MKMILNVWMENTILNNIFHKKIRFSPSSFSDTNDRKQSSAPAGLCFFVALAAQNPLRCFAFIGFVGVLPS